MLELFVLALVGFADVVEPLDRELLALDFLVLFGDDEVERLYLAVVAFRLVAEFLLEAVDLLDELEGEGGKGILGQF